MEKQANNCTRGLKKYFSLNFLLILTLLLSGTSILGQDLDFSNGKKYILGGLEVTGLESYNEQTVKTYTGLREGQPITIPGDEISEVLKKLWGLELFSDIAFYITKIEGETVFLELEIRERPTLSTVTITG